MVRSRRPIPRNVYKSQSYNRKPDILIQREDTMVTPGNSSIKTICDNRNTEGKGRTWTTCRHKHIYSTCNRNDHLTYNCNSSSNTQWLEASIIRKSSDKLHISKNHHPTNEHIYLHVERHSANPTDEHIHLHIERHNANPTDEHIHLHVERHSANPTDEHRTDIKITRTDLGPNVFRSDRFMASDRGRTDRLPFLILIAQAKKFQHIRSPYLREMIPAERGKNYT